MYTVRCIITADVFASPFASHRKEAAQRHAGRALHTISHDHPYSVISGRGIAAGLQSAAATRLV